MNVPDSLNIFSSSENVSSEFNAERSDVTHLVEVKVRALSNKYELAESQLLDGKYLEQNTDTLVSLTKRTVRNIMSESKGQLY